MSCKTKSGYPLANNSCMLNTEKRNGYPTGCINSTTGEGGYTNVSGTGGFGNACCIDNPPAKCIFTKPNNSNKSVAQPVNNQIMPAKVSPKGSLAPALVSDTKTMTGCLANPKYPVPIGDCEAYQGCDTKYRSNTTKLCCKINPKDPNNSKCFTKSASTPNSAKVSQNNKKSTNQDVIDTFNYEKSKRYNKSSFGSMNNNILIIIAACLICLVIIILLYLKIK